MADINALVKELGQLTVLEALELSKQLSKEWNIDLDSLQAAPAQAPAGRWQSVWHQKKRCRFGQRSFCSWTQIRSGEGRSQ